jgi:hypothetical protein
MKTFPTKLRRLNRIMQFIANLSRIVRFIETCEWVIHLLFNWPDDQT